MENVIPFEYGYAYRLIKEPIESDRNALQNMFHNELLPSWYEGNSYSSDHPWGQINIQGKGGDKILPVAFIAETQKVIAEVTIYEQETLNNLFSVEYNNFTKNSIKKHNYKLSWVEIPAQLFIRNFEKVL